MFMDRPCAPARDEQPTKEEQANDWHGRHPLRAFIRSLAKAAVGLSPSSKADAAGCIGWLARILHFFAKKQTLAQLLRLRAAATSMHLTLSGRVLPRRALSC